MVRFTSEELCEFEKKLDREVEGPSVVTERSGFFNRYRRCCSILMEISSTKTEKVVTTVTDYYWKFSSKYELSVFPGNDPSSKVGDDFVLWSVAGILFVALGLFVVDIFILIS